MALPTKPFDVACQSALKNDPLSASKNDPLTVKNRWSFLRLVYRATEESSRGFLEREWAKVLLVGAEERPLSGLSPLWLFPVFKAVTLVAGLYNVAMMGQAIQQGGGHLGIAKHLRPLAKAQIRGHDHGCLLVEPAQQMKQ